MVYTFQKLLQKRILILDGAIGTELQKLSFNSQEQSFDYLNITNPDIIKNIHIRYLDAHADIIKTNSFASNAIDLAEYGFASKSYEISKAAAIIAKSATKNYQNKLVAGSIGPTKEVLSISNNIHFHHLENVFYEQAKGLYDGGIDFFLIETATDLYNIKAALNACQKFNIPIAISLSLDQRLISGQDIVSTLIALSSYPLLYLGINCRAPSQILLDTLKTLHSHTLFPICLAPNAGLPNLLGEYSLNEEDFLTSIKEYFQYLNIVGGCCGTSPLYIKKIAKYINQNPKIKFNSNKKTTKLNKKFYQNSLLSEVSYININQEKKAVIVGERANVIGSKKFKEIIINKDYLQAHEIIFDQIKNGAQIIDLCLSYPEGNEVLDLKNFLKSLQGKIKTPLMLDTMSMDTLTENLSSIQGKAIINSINLEKGEKQFLDKAEFIKKYGHAIVLGLIDETKQAKTVKDKLKIAKRSFKLLKQFPQQDIYIDPLIFPCIGIDQDQTALETLKSIGKLKKLFPKSKTIIGLSNISFGLPVNTRPILNSVYLHLAVKEGLDLAIANPQKLIDVKSLTPEVLSLAKNILLKQCEKSLHLLKKVLDQKNCSEKKYNLNLSTIDAQDSKILTHNPSQSIQELTEMLQSKIIYADKNDVIACLDQVLLKKMPQKIIDEILMPAMNKLGVLFEKSEVIISEVLRSTEVMNIALNYLASKFPNEKSDVKKKTFILATVKGDVHDIGKNLVDMIFSNNNFNVINLGVRVESQTIIDAIKKYNADFVGLSALLVQSTLEIINTAKCLKENNISIPLFCGGASVGQSFVQEKIKNIYPNAYYAGDAMNSLKLAQKIFHN